MRSLLIPIIVSLAVHGLLAVGLVAYLTYAPEPDVLATLDLSSVELSFTEKVEESAAVMPLPAASPAKPEVRPKQERPPIPDLKKAKPLPPDPSDPKFREPTEAPSTMETPQLREREEVQQSETSTPAPAQAVPAPRQARVDAPPRPRRTIRPDYPKGARQRGEQGEVTLEIRVDAEGAVSEASVVASSGFADLDEAAVRAAQKAKFSPAKSGSKAVASVARLTLSFRLK